MTASRTALDGPIHIARWKVLRGGETGSVKIKYADGSTEDCLVVLPVDDEASRQCVLCARGVCKTIVDRAPPSLTVVRHTHAGKS